MVGVTIVPRLFETSTLKNLTFTGVTFGPVIVIMYYTMTMALVTGQMDLFQKQILLIQ